MIIGCSIKPGAYVTVDVYKSANVTVHKFENLNHTRGFDILWDSAMCKVKDTVVVKKAASRIYIKR